MPIYEYRCRGCDTRSSILVRRLEEAGAAVCPGCGSGDLERLFSRFAYHRSMKAIQEAAGDPQLVPGPDQYQDPRNVGRWTEKRFSELGLEVPPEVRESIDAAREGEPPPSLKEML